MLLTAWKVFKYGVFSGPNAGQYRPEKALNTYLNTYLNTFHAVIFHNYARIIVDSYDSLPLEKTFTFYVMILIKSVFN